MTYAERAYGEGTYGEGALAAPDITIPDADQPIPLLDWSPTTDPLETPSWVSIESRLLGFKTKQGRNRDLDAYETATAEFTVENHDRELDPDNTASDFYPYVRTLKRIRYRELWNDVIYPRFDGFVEDWDYDNGYPLANDAKIAASDAFIVFAGIPMPSSVWAWTLRDDNPIAWWRLGDAERSAVASDSVGKYPGTYEGSPSSTSAVVGFESDGAVQFNTPLQYVRLGGVPISGNKFCIEFWANIDNQDAADPTIFSTQPGHNAVTCRVRIDEDGNIAFSNRWEEDPVTADDVSILAPRGREARHHIVIARDGDLMYLWVNGVASIANGDFAPGPDITPGVLYGFVGGTTIPTFFSGAVDEVLVYDYILSPARIAAHYAAGTAPWDGDTTGERLNRLLDVAGVPSTWRDIDTGIGKMGPQALGGKLLDHMRVVERAEQGELYMTAENKVRFVNRHARIIPPGVSVATYSTTGTGFAVGAGIKQDRGYDLIRNVVRGSRSGGAEYEVRDPALTATSVVREDSDLMDLPVREDNSVRHLLAQRLLLYKDETVRFSDIELTGIGEEDDYYPEMLGRKIGDRITVEYKQAGIDGSPYVGEQYIERIEHEASDVHRKVTFSTSPASPVAWFIPDDPVYGLPNGLNHPAA